MAVSYSICDLLAVFGCVNALVFLHVGAPFRRLMSGSNDRVWRSNIAAYNNNTEVQAEFTLKDKFFILFLGRLAHCHACAGFWVGVAYAFLCLPIESWIESVQFGLVSSAFCLILWLLCKSLGVDKL
jgi:hypothetical protein